jgi:hypothetical protein
MIIKRWNGSAFVEEYPKTKAQLLYNDANNDSIFDSNDKIKINYLPNAVFDSLFFYATNGINANLGPLARNAINHALNTASPRRSALGYYYVATASHTLTPSTTSVLYTDMYIRTYFGPSEEGVAESTTAITVETGDWYVISKITGAGTIGDPYDVYFAVVNNTYELATTSADGIVRLSSRSTYAGLTGNNVVTESVLKTVIDNASYAVSTHVHGDINNNGTITATAVSPADTDYILISDTSASGAIERGILVGTGTTTYLRNDGTWGTPAGNYTLPAATATVRGGIELFSDTQQSVAANAVSSTASRSYGIQVNSDGQGVVNVPWTDTTYSAGEGITLSSTTFRMTYPLYVQTTTPTTTIAGALWYDIN